MYNSICSQTELGAGQDVDMFSLIGAKPTSQFDRVDGAECSVFRSRHSGEG